MHIKKMVIRIILDAFLIMAGVFIVTVFRALFPTHLPNIYTPKDIGLNYEEVTFPASDGTKLSGWLIYHTNAKATIICCHGYPANKSDILPVVSFLYPRFNLLLFDFRGHGDSEGRLVSFGLREDRDVLGAVNYINENPKLTQLPIGIWGYSLGGAVAIKTCAQKENTILANKKIKALVVDSSYASFPEMIIQYYGNLGPLKYLFGFGGKFIGSILFKGELSQLSPENFVDSLDIPILIIHASGDPLVPVEHANRLYDKAKQPKQLLIALDKTHGVNATAVYRDKIKNFFVKYLFDGTTIPSGAPSVRQVYPSI